MSNRRWMMLLVIAGVAGIGACKDEGNDGTSGAGTGGVPFAGTGGLGGTGASGMGGASGTGAGGSMAGSGGAAGMTAGAGGSAGAAGAAGAMAAGMGASGMGGMGASGMGGASGMAGGGPLMLTSSAVQDGGQLPAEHRCVALGGDTGPSPELSWTGGPSGALSWALTMTDTTAGISMNYAHWTIYDIPASVMMLAEGVPEGAMPAMPAGAKQAPNQNAFVGGPGYFGPCGSPGTFTYEFELHAIDVAMLPGLSASSTAAQVRAAIDEHSLESATLTVMSME